MSRKTGQEEPAKTRITKTKALHLKIYKKAVQCYQSGNLLKTGQLCREILEVEDDHLNAHNLLAAVYGQTGELERAISLLKRVIELNPGHVDAHNNLGITYHNLGQLDDAVASYNQAIKLKPGFSDPHYNLGLILFDLGRFDEAESSQRQALKLKPNHVDAHASLGTILNNQGRLTEAVDCYRHALRLGPATAMTHFNLGCTLYDLGQLDEAIASCDQAIAINPKYTEAHFNLGNMLKSQGRLEEAADSYRRAIETNSDYAEAHYNLGYTLYDLDRLEESVASYQQAINLQPDHAEAWCNLGNSLNKMGRQDEALINYIKALQLKPDYPEAHNNLGTTLNELGRLDQAKTSYEQAIKLKPDYAEAHYHLGLIKTFEDGDSQIAVMEEWCSEPDLDITNQVFFSFALAKAYDDLGEYSKSFEQLQNANRLRKQELNYKFFSDQVHFSAIKNVFSTRKLPPFPPPTAGGNSVRPIFILGMPRSGTSLVEQVLASHSTVHGAGELNTLKNLITPSLFTRLDTDLQSQESFHNDILSLRKDYLDSLELLGVPERAITDKMPHNFKWIGWILLAFPEARIIHLNRDPVAICFSIFKRRFPTTGLGYGYDLNDLAAFYHLYRDLMSFWRERFPNEIYELDYEKFTENQEVETRKLLAFCDLDWEEQCLEFHNTQRIVKTASAVQVQQKLYQGSSEAWKKYKSYLEPLTQALHKSSDGM